MKETRILMGMPVTVEIVAADAARAARTPTQADLDAVFDYFTYVDTTFSTYKPESEIMRINRGELPEQQWSPDMRTVFDLARETNERSEGFFDIRTPDGSYDPSGIVKGWAILEAARLLERRGFKDFSVEAGGDVQVAGNNQAGEPWSVGIRNPFKQNEIVKTIYLRNTPQDGTESAVLGEAVATSGTYERGNHIYNPHNPKKPGDAAEGAIVSLTVVGPDILEADRWSTAAFAMGAQGIGFIEQFPGLEGYMIDSKGIATLTSGFERYTQLHA